MTETAYAIYRGSTEIYARSFRSLKCLFPGCTFGKDAYPVLISRHENLHSANEALALHRSSIRICDTNSSCGVKIDVIEYWIAMIQTDESGKDIIKELISCAPFIDKIRILFHVYTYDAEHGWIENLEQ